MKDYIGKLKFQEIFCFYAFSFCMFFFFYIMHQCFKTKIELPSEVDQIMIAVIGFTGAIVGYVVGSSKSSSDKDATIKQVMENKNPVANNSTASTLTLNWLGTFDTKPTNPNVNDAYVDSKQNKNFYWNGSEWILTTENPAK